MQLVGDEAEVETYKAKELEIQQAFQTLFAADRPAARVVLATLADFCFATRSTSSQSARTQAEREGQRKVWLLISQLANLPEEINWELLLERRLTVED